MNRRNRRIELRLTEQEAEYIREKSSGYSSVSHYIREAIAEFSDTDAKKRLELINELGGLYKSFHNELFHVSANLNHSRYPHKKLCRKRGHDCRQSHGEPYFSHQIGTY